MKKIFNPLVVVLTFVAVSFTSCNPDEIDPFVPKGTEDYTMNLPEGTNYRPVKEIEAPAGSLVDVVVNFSEPEKKMYRLYVSQNIYGSDEGTVAYDIEKNTPNADTKVDGSIDLKKGDKLSFSKTIKLSAPKQNNGIVEYKIWATGGGALSTAKGDFRDISKNNAYGDNNAYITIRIKAGNPTVQASNIKSFSATILAAPLADGSSKSFVSVYNGQVYAIKGASATAALWDFGYYYDARASYGAALVSTSTYPTTVNISNISGISKDKLNKFYFRKSSSLNFDTVTAEELASIQTPMSQLVKQLKVDDVIEFEDTYGTKGLIKVTKIVKGTGVRGLIQFDIKVQDLVLVNP